MPPGTLNWDPRRDFRRPATDPRFGGPHRWPERPHVPPPYQKQQQRRRWCSDSRSLPPGHGKQNVWRTYADSDGEGFMPFGSRYNDGNYEEEIPRPFSSRGNGGYFRNIRENKKPFNRRDWKAPIWEPAESRKSAIVNYLRSTGNSSTQTFHINRSQSSNTSNHPPKDGGDVEGLMEWKPLKRSLSSKIPGFSHSGSSKSMGVDSNNAGPIQSPFADCVSSITQAEYDENGSRKKPRIGWGEGLAKYEKKNVEGPEDGVKPYKSARVVGLSDCASPASPSSISRSSSFGNVHGFEEKASVKEENGDHDRTSLSCSASIVSRTNYGGPTYSLENLEIASITNLSSMINELLQSQDPTSDETDYVRTTSMNKLLVWKVDMLKALEITESEIDSLETEFKSLVTEPRVCDSPEGSMNLDVNLDEKCSSNGLSDENSGCVDDRVLIQTAGAEDLDNVHSNVDDIYDSILSANKNAGNRAIEELNKLLLPAKQHCSDTSIVCYLERDSPSVKKRFIIRKQRLQFKEKVLAVKYKVFQHFQNEGRLKTHKKFDPIQNGQKKNYPSALSRASFYVGDPQKALADEVIEFISRLISESAFKPYRKTLKMPALIFNEEMMMSRFISNNGLVDDPCAVEKERSMINPWTPEEKEIFIEKLAAFGKDFRKIASFLDHKTIADCVEFYYKNHKSECFEKIRKKSKQTKSQATTYLVASGKRWNRESNAVSLDMLGEASEFASKLCLGASSSSYGVPRGIDGQLQRSNSMDMNINERETIAADVLAGISGSLSSEAMSSSCITSSFDYQDWTKVCSSVKQPLTHEVTQDIDDDDGDYSDDSCEELNPTDWTDAEKSMFVDAFLSYGKDFIMISQFVGTRSIDQCKVFFSKTRKILGLDLIRPGAGTVNGGVSDVEDGCNTAETESIICNDNDSESNMEDDLPPPDMKLNKKSGNVGAQDLRPDVKISAGYNGLVSLDRESISSNSLTGCSEINVDSKEQNGVDVAFVSSNAEAEQGNEEKYDLALTNRWSEAGKKAAVDGHCGDEETYGKGVLFPEEYLDNKTVEERDANSSEESDISSGMSETKGIHGNINCEKRAPLQNVPNQAQDLHSGLSLEKCNVSRQQSQELGISSAVDDKSSRNGVVKLFGKILSSSQEKPNPSVQQFDDDKNSNLNKLSGDQKVRLDSSSQSKFNNCNDYTLNIASRNFGFWNGKRIQTGFPPLPDSARLLAKFPDTFSNHALPTLNGVSVFPPQDVVFADMQRKNGYDVMLEMQQQARGMLGINAVKEDDRWRSNGDIGR